MSPAEGRKFAFPVGTAFLVLGGITLWRGHMTVSQTLLVLGGVLWVAGLIIPGRLGPVYHAWMGMAHAISKVTTPLFMGITYYLVLTPIGLLMRLFGKHPLVHAANEGSHWIERPEGARKGDLTRQF